MKPNNPDPFVAMPHQPPTSQLQQAKRRQTALKQQNAMLLNKPTSVLEDCLQCFSSPKEGDAGLMENVSAKHAVAVTWPG